MTIIKDVLILSDEEVRSLVTISDVVKLVEDSFRYHGKGETIIPHPSSLTVGKDSRMHAMTAYVKSLKIVGTKWGGSFKYNLERFGLPGHVPMIILNDSATGAPFAIMSAVYITSARTGSVTAVGAKYLAAEKSKIVGIIGAGVQARGNLEALNNILDIEQVKVSSRRKVSYESFAKEMGRKLGLEVKGYENPDDVVNESDVVVTATPSREDFVKDRFAKKGVLVVTLGSYQEVEDAFVKRVDKIIIDSLESFGGFADMIRRSVVSKDDVFASLGEIVANKRIGRKSESERILFSHTGMAIHDIVVGYEVYKRAVNQGIGEKKRLF